jgi:hypothetical protein
MGKLKFTKEELETKYREKLDVFLDDCDWVTHVTGYMVCSLVSTCLEEFKVQISREKLYEKYTSKVKSLGLGDEKWRDTYGITEIIGLIYTLIEEEVY